MPSWAPQRYSFTLGALAEVDKYKGPLFSQKDDQFLAIWECYKVRYGPMVPAVHCLLRTNTMTYMYVNVSANPREIDDIEWSLKTVKDAKAHYKVSEHVILDGEMWPAHDVTPKFANKPIKEEIERLRKQEIDRVAKVAEKRALEEPGLESEEDAPTPKRLRDAATRAMAEALN